MRQQISVYLSDENRQWLRNHSKQTGTGMSTLLNIYVAERRQASEKSDRISRAFETARLADLENES